VSFTGTVKVGKSVAPSPTGLLEEKRRSDQNAPILEEGNLLSRIKTADQRLTRVVEGGLSSGMVLLTELEGNGVSRLSNNSAGVE
jgi:hypothetical protein